MASAREPLVPTAERPHRCEYCGLCRSEKDMYSLASRGSSRNQCYKCAKDFASMDAKERASRHRGAIDVSHPAYTTRFPRKATGQRAAPHLPTGSDEDYRTYRED